MSYAPIKAMNLETENKKEYDLLYMYEYTISNEHWFYFIPKIVTKYRVELLDVKENRSIAEARYIITPFSSTAELKKAHDWFNKKEPIKKHFLPRIIQNIKKEYPDITCLIYKDKNQIISWNI